MFYQPYFFVVVCKCDSDTFNFVSYHITRCRVCSLDKQRGGQLAQSYVDAISAFAIWMVDELTYLNALHFKNKENLKTNTVQQ